MSAAAATSVAAVVLALSAAFAAYLFSLPEPLRRLDGHRVLVTGASSGLGAALAARYAALGAELLLTARRPAPLREVAELCRRAGSPRVRTLTGDLTDPDHRGRLLAEASRHGLDLLLLNHGAVRAAPWRGDLRALGDAMDANFASHVELALGAMPLLRAAGGRLGVVSSLSAQAPAPLMAAYAASKAAQRSYFAALRQELAMAGANVTVTTALLGAVATDAYVAVQERHFHWINLFGAASPEDAARAIVDAVWRRDGDVVYPLVARVQLMVHAVVPEIYEYNWNQVVG